MLNSSVVDAITPKRFLATSDGSIAFMKALGIKAASSEAAKKQARREIAQQLHDRHIHDMHANIIVDRAIGLSSSAAVTGEELNAKFACEAGFEFEFGGKSEFFKGLEERIGVPQPDILRAMVFEHCEEVDSKRSWTTGNYGISTTSEIELLFVLQDVFAQLTDGDTLKKLICTSDVDEWRRDADRLKMLTSAMPIPAAWPVETKNAANPRSQNRQKTWLVDLLGLNNLLREDQQKPLLLAEAVALCLYTGPMFEKYNNTCRGGPLHDRPSDLMRMNFFRLCGGSDADAEASGSAQSPDTSICADTCVIVSGEFLETRFPCTNLVSLHKGDKGVVKEVDEDGHLLIRFGETQANLPWDAQYKWVSPNNLHNLTKAVKLNRYTTTIHVLASALIKASKLSKACTVMRGTTGGRLPSTFWQEDASGVKGGVEYGFMSTTTNRDVAIDYASDPKKGAGTVLEMQTGMIDKGAELSWISQYPHEKELCFPPLTSMQVLGTYVEGRVLVVSIRLNLNLTSLTIEEVIGKRRKVAIDMCQNLLSEARAQLKEVTQGEAGAAVQGQQHDDLASTVLSRLEGEFDAICSREADSFNSDADFQAYLKDSLELKQAAVQCMSLLGAGWAKLAAEAQTTGLRMRRLLAGEGPLEAQAALKALETLGGIHGRAKSTVARSRVDACGELAAFAGGMGGAAAGALQLLDELGTDSDPSVRLAAAWALPACYQEGGPEVAARAAELLERHAGDSSWRARAAAVEVLPACWDRAGRDLFKEGSRVLDGLTRDDPHGGVRAAALGAQLACFERASPDEHRRIVRFLRLLAKKAQVEVPSPFPGGACLAEVAAVAAALLGGLAKNSDVEVREAAVRALPACQKGGPEVASQVVELLAGLAEDSEHGVRSAVCCALLACCEQGGPELARRVMEVLTGLAVDPAPVVRAALCQALSARCQKGGPEVASQIVELLAGLAEDSFLGVRSAVCGALLTCCEQGGPELARRVMEVLAGLAVDPEPVVRAATCQVLSASCQKGGPEVASQIVELLAGLAKDSEPGVRSAACGALPACCQRGDPEIDARVVEQLSSLAKDSDQGVRSAALQSLMAFCQQGGPELAACVTKALAALAGDADTSVRSAAFRALTTCREKGSLELAARIVEVLGGLAGDSQSGVRASAILALARCRGAGGPRLTVTELTLSGELKDPTPEQAAGIGECLRLCDHLETLNLSCCGIGGAAAVALLEGGLPAGLRELDVQSNAFGAEGARALAAALSSSGLRELHAESNDLDDEAQAALRRAAPRRGGTRCRVYV